MSVWEVVLPAPRRRHAAGRERHDLPSYVLFIAHLQSSLQGQCGCWRSPHGHCGRRVEGERLDRDRSLTSTPGGGEPMAKATAEHRIMVCRRVWLPSASPHRWSVLGPTSGAKGTAPLSTRELRHRVVHLDRVVHPRWAEFIWPGKKRAPTPSVKVTKDGQRTYFHIQLDHLMQGHNMKNGLSR